VYPDGASCRVLRLNCASFLAFEELPEELDNRAARSRNEKLAKGEQLNAHIFFYVMAHAPLVMWAVAMEGHVSLYRGSAPTYQSAAPDVSDAA
jgi:hypothetical protein